MQIKFYGLFASSQFHYVPIRLILSFFSVILISKGIGGQQLMMLLDSSD